MSAANPGWGTPRIHGELGKLGIKVSQTTVAKYMVRHRRPPSQTWRTFLNNHVKDLASADFFVVPTVTFRLLFGESATAKTSTAGRQCDANAPPFLQPFRLEPRLRSRPRPARIYGVNTPTRTSETFAVPSEPWRMPEATDLIFPKWQRELFKTILDEQNLRFDREGRPRTAYSLRHTYICLRLMEGADIYQIAKNCRTSVEMIEKYYAAHIKTLLDAAAINVMRPHKYKSKSRKKAIAKSQTSPLIAEHGSSVWLQSRG